MTPFEQHRDAPIWGAVARVRLLSRREVPIALRLDARGPTVRVDLGKPLSPWEAIDGGEGFASVEQAEVFAGRWLAAANEQGTLSPAIRRHQ